MLKILGVATLWLVGCLTTADNGLSQERVPDPSLAARAFADAVRTNTLASSSEAGWVPRIMSKPATFPPHIVLGVLEELEKLALSRESERVRLSSVIWLSTPGDARTGSKSTVPGIVARLSRVYQQSRSSAVRSTIVHRLPSQTETGAALAALEAIATEASDLDPSADFPASQQALNSLLLMGDAGRNVLQRLHSRGAVRNPSAQAYLASLAANSFKRPH